SWGSVGDRAMLDVTAPSMLPHQRAIVPRGLPTHPPKDLVKMARAAEARVKCDLQDLCLARGEQALRVGHTKVRQVCADAQAQCMAKQSHRIVRMQVHGLRHITDPYWLGVVLRHEARHPLHFVEPVLARCCLWDYARRRVAVKRH